MIGFIGIFQIKQLHKEEENNYKNYYNGLNYLQKIDGNIKEINEYLLLPLQNYDEDKINYYMKKINELNENKIIVENNNSTKQFKDMILIMSISTFSAIIISTIITIIMTRNISRIVNRKNIFNKKSRTNK